MDTHPTSEREVGAFGMLAGSNRIHILSTADLFRGGIQQRTSLIGPFIYVIE